MSLRHEFGWGVTPAVPEHWQHTFEMGGFDVEVKATSIEARADAYPCVHSQQKRAEALVVNLIRVIGLREQKQFTARYSSFARLNTETNKRDITVYLEPLSMKLSVGQVDVVVTDQDGNVVFDSKKKQLDDVAQAATAAAGNETLQRMIDFRLAYFADEHKDLGNLFNIVELAEAEFGADKAAAALLGVSRNDLERVGRIANDASIRAGRHPGQTLQPQRDPTAQELSTCERIADAIIAGQLKHLGL